MGLTQAALAIRLGCSSSLVSHIELGNRNPQVDFAEACDRVFGLAFKLSKEHFQQLRRKDRNGPSWPGWFIRWADDIEPNALVLRTLDPLVIPGLLQTENYARAIFKGGRVVPTSEIEERVAARMQRKLILERENPPELWVLIDEMVLKRPIGGPKVMTEQLEYILPLADRPNVRIQLVPFDSPCTDSLLSGFSIAEMPDGAMAVSIESAGTGEVSAERELLSAIWGQYDRIRAEAYRPGESLQKIKEVRDQWQRKQET